MSRTFDFVSTLLVVLFVSILGVAGPGTQNTNPNAVTQPSDLQSDPGTDPHFENIWTKQINAAGMRMKETGMVLCDYTKKHRGQMPADLGSLGSYFVGGDPRECVQTPGDQRLTAKPDQVTAGWINAHSSYVYLAANVNFGKLDPSINPAGTTIIAFHTKLDQPFTSPKLGEVIIATCLDGHSELLPLKEASAEIALSKKFLDAARSPSH